MGYRLNVAATFINNGNPVNKVLKFAKIHKTTWYRFKNCSYDKRHNNPGRPIPGYSYDKFKNKIFDADIISAIREIRCHEFLMISGGYKKLKYYLYNIYGYIVNKKKVYRLCKENNFLLPQKTSKKI